MTRKLSLKVMPLLLGSVFAAGFGIASNAQADELRIGFIAPVTGIFAQIGKDMTDGFQLYLDQHGGKLGGADVKFIVEDDQGKPDTGVTKAKKLILQDKVNMFIGGLLASTGYALAPVSTAEKTLYISSISSATKSDAVCSVAPRATARRITGSNARTSGVQSSGYRTNEQSYTLTSVGSRLGGAR